MTLRTPLLALLLILACDGPSTPPPQTPPPTPTAAPSTPSPAPSTPDKPAADQSAEEGAGFASPKQVEEPAAEPKPGGKPDAELVARIKEKFGDSCKYERACGDLVGIDCNSAADGPYYYATRKDLSTVSTCGGACRRGCTDCPPKAWTCPTY